MDKYIRFNLKNFKTVILLWVAVYLVLGFIGFLKPGRYSDNIKLPESIATKIGGGLRGESSFLVIKKDKEASLELEKLKKAYKLVYSGKIGSEIENYSINESDKGRLKKLYKELEEYNNCEVCSRFGVRGAIANYGNTPKESKGEIVGVLFALALLFFAFGNLLSALIPIVVALVSLLGAFLALGPLSNIMSIPSFAPMMMSLLAIGVGIDYSLFIISRFRHSLEQGEEKRVAVEKAFNTSGRAVIFAGLTVVICLFGILLAGVPFLNGLAISSTLGVLFTMLNVMVILPKFLEKTADKLINKKEMIEQSHDLEDGRGFFNKIAGNVSSRPFVFFGAGAVILAILILFYPSLRIGASDASQALTKSPVKVYYEYISSNAGVGMVDPYIVVSPTSEIDRVRDLVSSEFKIASEEEVGGESILTVPSLGSAHSRDAEEGFKRLRTLLKESSGVRVNGSNLVYYELSNYIKGKLYLFVIIVSLVSFLLLLLIFQSLVLSVVSVLSNIVVTLASFGVLGLIFEKGLIGSISSGDTPINPFLPILFLAILFGLAMDYQVFLLSRIKEEYNRSNDIKSSVLLAVSQTGKVITSAALIMVAVFTSFALGPDLNIKMAGLGLASSIFIDAFIMRSFIVPSLFFILGEKIWYTPESVKRFIPKINIGE